MRLQNNDLWPIPITLDVTEDYAKKLTVGNKMVLRDKEGFALAVLAIGSIWKPDRKKEAEQVYGTINESHPGVNYVLHESNPIYIGGSVEGIHFPNFKMPNLVIKKAIRSSISDLISKGVKPEYYFISGSGNKNQFTKKNLKMISKSLNQEQKKYNLKLSGGDTTNSNKVSFSIERIKGIKLIRKYFNK